jgi:ribosome modulation factor
MARQKKAPAAAPDAEAPKKRGRKPGAAKKPNPETAPLTGGHNDMSDDQKRALFLNGLGKLEAVKEKMAKLNADARNIRKQMKSEGYSKVEVDYALFLNKQSDDPDRIAEERQARERVAKWLARPEGFQGGLFDGPGDGKDRTPAVDRAKEEGKTAGMQGESAKPPYDASTPQGQAWLHGHADGQATLAKGFKPLPPSDEDEDGEDVRPRHLREKGMPSAGGAKLN